MFHSASGSWLMLDSCAEGPVNGRWQFSTPTEFTPLNRSPKNCYRWLCWQPLWLCQIWCKSVHGVFSANGWNITIFFIYLYIFIRRSPTGQTRQRIFTFDGSNNSDSSKGCAFWGFCWHGSPFWEWNPQNPNFGGVNWRFQDKRAKYWKFHIIETRASIPTNFSARIETTK